MKRFACLIAVAVVSAAGCSVRAPYGISWDRHNFASYPYQQKIVSIVSQQTNETLWRLEVPVNKMAVVDLGSQSWASGTYATEVAWEVFKPNAFIGVLANKQELPGHPVKIVVDVRTPESWRPAAAAAPAPAPAMEEAPPETQPAEEPAPAESS